MPSTIALLRGVNVGGHNKVPMAALRTALEAVGYEDVETYVASGNVALRSSKGPAAVAAEVHRVIAAEFGLDIAVLTRTAAQLRKVVAANPFVKQEADSGKLLVGFLEKKPTKAAVDAVDPRRAAPDELRMIGREVFFWCPNGWGNSKVSNGLEKALGTAMTARNWRTVTTLLEMATR